MPLPNTTPAAGAKPKLKMANAKLDWLLKEPALACALADRRGHRFDIPEYIPDQRWAKQFQVFKLPADARRAIDICIWYFRSTKDDSKSFFTPDERKTFQKCRSHASKLHKKVSAILDNERLWNAVSMGRAGQIPYTPAQKLRARQMWEWEKEHLQRIDRWVLNEANDRLSIGKGGAGNTTGDLRQFVTLLDVVLHNYTGQRLTSRGNCDLATSFVKEVWAIAEGAVVEPTDRIDAGIRLFLERRDNGVIQNFDDVRAMGGEDAFLRMVFRALDDGNRVAPANDIVVIFPSPADDRRGDAAGGHIFIDMSFFNLLRTERLRFGSVPELACLKATASTPDETTGDAENSASSASSVARRRSAGA